MSRRRSSEKRAVHPDPKFGDEKLTKFMNCTMVDGKKSKAETIVYGALEKVHSRTSRDPLEIFKLALENATPHTEVRSRRIGGATYQVPVEVRKQRGEALAMRWLISASRGRSEKTMGDRLAAELVEASENRGAAVKKREDTHKMADANKAFAHYRW